MGTAFVYAPITGVNWGQACYCTKTVTCTDGVVRQCRLTAPCAPVCPCSPNCNPPCNCNAGNTTCPHATSLGGEGWGAPLDISASPNQSVKFYSTTGIQSIRTQKRAMFCGNTGTWAYGVLVSLYSDFNGTVYIGGVMYGHLLESSILPDLWYQNNVWGRELGKVPGTNCGCNCYNGFHVHLQRRWGQSQNFGTCQAQIWAGQIPIYTFNN